MALKVLHVVFSLDPGGMENGLVNVASGLDPRAFDVHVCCLERRGLFADRLPNPEQVYVLDKPPGKSLKTAYHVAQLVRRLKPDVVHSHNLGPLIYSVLGSGLGRMAPILQGEHGTLPPEEMSPQRLRQRSRLYRFCRQVHTVSDNLQTHLVELGFDASKITSILNGVDTERFQPGDGSAVRRELGIPEDACVLGIVGRFILSKRHGVLFDAVARLKAAGMPLHVIVVGDGGGDADTVRQQAAACGAAELIHLVGFQADPLRYYRALDLLVVPSEVEGLSNAVLEAMAAGVPVMSNDVCGSGEVITHGRDGLMEGMRDVEELAAALESACISRQGLAEMGALARQTVLQGFSIGAMVRAYAELYRRVAGFPAESR